MCRSRKSLPTFGWPTIIQTGKTGRRRHAGMIASRMAERWHRPLWGLTVGCRAEPAERRTCRWLRIGRGRRVHTGCRSMMTAGRLTGPGLCRHRLMRVQRRSAKGRLSRLELSRLELSRLELGRRNLGRLHLPTGRSTHRRLAHGRLAKGGVMLRRLGATGPISGVQRMGQHVARWRRRHEFLPVEGPNGPLDRGHRPGLPLARRRRIRLAIWFLTIRLLTLRRLSKWWLAEWRLAEHGLVIFGIVHYCPLMPPCCAGRIPSPTAARTGHPAPPAPSQNASPCGPVRPVWQR